MYHCHVCFYVIGQGKILDIVKEMPPLEHFMHTFTHSGTPDASLAAKADVILADLAGMDADKTVRMLAQTKRKEAELILLVNREQNVMLVDELPQIKDIWMMPMADEEIRFRFKRWQQTYKVGKDFWETSQYLEATINNVPNLVWYKDKNGIHEKVNDSFCKTVNKVKEQVEGQGHAYIWDVDHDDPACIESENQVMGKRETCVSEEVIQASDGMKTLITYKSPLYDCDDSVMGTVGVAIDVTRERTYEEELLKKNRIMESIFTSIDCGVLCHSLDGSRILSVNNAAIKILGYESREELVEKGFNMIAPSVIGEDRPQLVEKIGQLKKEGDSTSVEYRVRHKNGDIVHVMGNVKLINENGELFYQRFLLDCTEQKLQMKKKEQHQMELVYALSMDYNLVCFFDLFTGSGDVLRNDDYDGCMFGSIFGENMMLEECMGLYTQQYVHEEDREMMRAAFTCDRIQSELREKKSYCVRYRVAKESTVEYYEIKIARAGTQEHYGAVIGFHSVDEETRSEMKKKEMMEDALQQANKANKAKSEFLSNMSHDIRTPMNAIAGFTTLALSRIDRTDQVKEYLEKILTSGNHLLSLINDVLDMSRIESGKIRLDEKPCSLPDVMHGLCNILQADILAKKQEFYIDTVDVYHEEVYCDRLRLNQVLLNVVSNAIKYTESGGAISIRITEEKDARDGYGKYTFFVKDTGMGMSEEFLTHIFDPFEREENSTISGIQGTGLGMAITKNIVDMMSGNIEVRSKQGVGSEFTISFVFRLHPVESDTPDVPEVANCRALVVDNDANNCKSAVRMLEQIGMRAEWVLTGDEAVSRARQAVEQKDEYKVYVVGWMLPKLDGIDVVRKIRNEAGEHAVVIMLTAYDWTDIGDKAREAGVSIFCNKPMFMSELKNNLYAVLHGRRNEEKSVDGRTSFFQGGRILLAEDVELNQELAVAILSDAGLETEVADNGKIAVEMLSRSEPGYYQVVLMDIQMPMMNGYEATRAIRNLENKELASIPILAMSANAFEEDKQEALKCGMDGHIAKPIDVDAMFDTLSKVLR